MSDLARSTSHPLDDSDLVTVIVPTFNGGQYLRETLERVLTQTHPTLEVLIVDDGSTDDSLEIARRHLSDRRVSVITKPHMGIAGGRNVGLAHASPQSSFVVFLDQDDLLASNILERLVRVLRNRPEAVGSYAIADFVDADGAPFGDGYFAREMRTRVVPRGMNAPSPEADVTLEELFLRNHVYPPSAALLRTDAVCAVGGLDEAYSVADDWDLMVRLLRRGPIVPLDELLVGYRRHGKNASGNLRRNIRETRMVWSSTYYAADRVERRCLSHVWRAAQRAKARSKADDARRLVKERLYVRALFTAADAIAHLLLARPLRVWRPKSRLRNGLLEEYRGIGKVER